MKRTARYLMTSIVCLGNLFLGLLASFGYLYVLGLAVGGVVVSKMPERLRPDPLPWYMASKTGENLFSLLYFGGPVIILGLLILFNWLTKSVALHFGYRILAFLLGVCFPGMIIALG